MLNARIEYEDWLSRVARGDITPDQLSTLENAGVPTLKAISQYLESNELTIDAVERVEDVVKRTVGSLASGAPSLDDARDLAVAMSRIGFFHKLKSYAVKAASPLGYSVFFQLPGEGFSFQRHITHKIEVFHIVSAPPSGAYAFVCEYEAWKSAYEPARFQRWLEGAPDSTYDRFRHVPEPGDMIVIDRLNVVHTVIGCVLEEFATVSTDMVDRLHDQNVGRPIPPDFPRARVNGLLRELPAVEPRRILDVGPNGLVERAPRVETHPWGEVRSVAIGPLTARHWVVKPGATVAAPHAAADASSIFVRTGKGSLVLSPGPSAGEIPLEPGVLTLVPAGVRFSLTASAGTELRVSQQSLPLETAFGA